MVMYYLLPVCKAGSIYLNLHYISNSKNKAHPYCSRIALWLRCFCLYKMSSFLHKDHAIPLRSIVLFFDHTDTALENVHPCRPYPIPRCSDSGIMLSFENSYTTLGISITIFILFSVLLAWLHVCWSWST